MEKSPKINKRTPMFIPESRVCHAIGLFGLLHPKGLKCERELKVKVYKFILKFLTKSQTLSDSTNLRREVAYPNHYWIE